MTFSSSAVSVQHSFHKCFVFGKLLTTLLAFICMFYTKAYTVKCEAIGSRKGIVKNMEHFYTKVFGFVIHFLSRVVGCFENTSEYVDIL